MSNEYKMREECRQFLLDYESNNDHHATKFDVWKEATNRCAAIKDAEKQTLEQAAQDEINRLEEQKFVLSEKIAAQALMIKELREALKNTSCRTDGDGKDCWCTEMQSGLFKGSHAKWCLNAREVLAKSEHHNPRST